MMRASSVRRWLVLLLTLVAAVGFGLLLPWIMRGTELLAARWTQSYWLLLLIILPVVLWRGTFGDRARSHACTRDQESIVGDSRCRATA